MELSPRQISSQAAAQASALASLMLLRKTLELQAASTANLMQSVAPQRAREQSGKPGQQHRCDGLRPPL